MHAGRHHSERGSLRGLVQAIGEQLAALSAALERMYQAAFVTSGSVGGVYRGSVVADIDPLRQGRVQVLVPAVLAEPIWAPVSQPAGVIAVGAQVWVGYEAGQPGLPVVIGSQ